MTLSKSPKRPTRPGTEASTPPIDWFRVRLLERTNWRTLSEIAKAIPKHLGGGGGEHYPSFDGQTKREVVQWIRGCRQKHWDEQLEHDNRPKRGPSLCTITATECDDWLRTLPPTPPHGETHQKGE